MPVLLAGDSLGELLVDPEEEIEDRSRSFQAATQGLPGVMRTAYAASIVIEALMSSRWSRATPSR